MKSRQQLKADYYELRHLPGWGGQDHLVPTVLLDVVRTLGTELDPCDRVVMPAGHGVKEALEAALIAAKRQRGCGARIDLVAVAVKRAPNGKVIERIELGDE